MRHSKLPSEVLALVLSYLPRWEADAAAQVLNIDMRRVYNRIGEIGRLNPATFWMDGWWDTRYWYISLKTLAMVLQEKLGAEWVWFKAADESVGEPVQYHEFYYTNVLEGYLSVNCPDPTTLQQYMHNGLLTVVVSPGLVVECELVEGVNGFWRSPRKSRIIYCIRPEDW